MSGNNNCVPCFRCCKALPHCDCRWDPAFLSKPTPALPDRPRWPLGTITALRFLLVEAREQLAYWQGKTGRYCRDRAEFWRLSILALEAVLEVPKGEL